MFAQIFLARQTITFLTCAALISILIWRIYSAGENHAIQTQERNDRTAEQKADDVRKRFIGTSTDGLLENDPFLRK